MKELSKKGQLLAKPIDIIKEPYVLEFLELKEEAAYTESELEQAIINKIENFLLELGKGFYLTADKKEYLLMETIFTWIWFSIIAS